MGDIPNILKSIVEVIMCLICEHVQMGIVSEYEAAIWVVELQNFIGEKHVKEIQTYLTRPKVKYNEDLEVTSTFIDDYGGWSD